jgi:hypothetical protein
MNPKIVALVLGAVVIGGITAGGVWWYRKRKAAKANEEAAKTPQGPTPSNPPRKPEGEVKPPPRPAKRNPFDFVDASQVHPDLVRDLAGTLDTAWPPDEQAIDTMVDKLEYGDVVVCAVQSNPDEIFEEPRQELINASVLSVENKSTRDATIVRARVIGPVAHTDDHGNFAGHRIHVGAQIEVPRRFVLAVARRKPTDTSGYGSRGEAAAEFDPSNRTNTVYKVHPGTPYDLVMPYRTENLHWYPNRENVKVEMIGEQGELQQIMFTEASVRGRYTLTVLDHDEKAGKVFVARWDFELAE